MSQSPCSEQPSTTCSLQLEKSPCSNKEPAELKINNNLKQLKINPQVSPYPHLHLWSQSTLLTATSPLLCSFYPSRTSLTRVFFSRFLVFLPFSHFLLTIFVISTIIFEPMMPRALFGAPSLYLLGPSRHFNSAVLQSPPVQHVSEFIIFFSKTGAPFCIHSVAPSFPRGTRLVHLFLSSFTCPHACFPVSGWLWSLCIWNITAFDPHPSSPPSLLLLRSVESSLRALVFPKWKKNSHVNIQAI